jgi:hypothetical protein
VDRAHKFTVRDSTGVFLTSHFDSVGLPLALHRRKEYYAESLLWQHGNIFRRKPMDPVILVVAMLTPLTRVGDIFAGKVRSNH